jgi:hypothetical protein
MVAEARTSEQKHLSGRNHRVFFRRIGPEQGFGHVALIDYDGRDRRSLGEHGLAIEADRPF